MYLFEIFEAAIAAPGLLAKTEVIDWMNTEVIVNPRNLLNQMLRTDPHHEVRILTLGQDIAICPSWNIIHQDMAAALAHASHPSWKYHDRFWYMGDGCWFLNHYPEGYGVIDKKSQPVPEDRWPRAVKRAVKN